MKCGECFTTLLHKNDYYEFPNCGWIILDEEVDSFDIDDYKASMHHNADLVEPPVGCQTCGGEYPLCAESCPLFD